MSDCPDIAALESLLDADDRQTIKHVEGCTACQALMQLLVDRDERDRSLAGECARFELLAARLEALPADDQRALDGHVRDCAGCRALLEESP